MKMFRGAVLVLIVFVNLSEIYSAPAEVDNSKTQILYNEYNLNPDGNYNYKYKLSDGQAVDVEGELNDIGGSSIYKVKGLYTFVGTDGKVYTVNYVADENGYRTGKENAPPSIIPTSPRPTQVPVVLRTETPKPLKPGDAGYINPRTIAGTFG